MDIRKETDLTIRMSLATYNAIRAYFYKRVNESAESYFKRLAVWIKEQKQLRLNIKNGTVGIGNE